MKTSPLLVRLTTLQGELSSQIDIEKNPVKKQELQKKYDYLLDKSDLFATPDIDPSELEDILNTVSPDFEIESLDSLKAETIPGQPWLINDFIPADGFVLLAGEEATGKSFLTLSLAQSITTGEKWLDHFEVTIQTKVLFIDMENGRRRLQDRLRGLSMSGENIYRIKFPHLFYLSEKDKLSPFAESVAFFVKEKEIGLIVVDSLVDVMEGNENVAGDVQAFFNKFRLMFPQSAILILHHEGKPGMVARTAAQKTRGSTNIQGQMSASFSVSRIPKTVNELKFEQTKARDSAKMKPFKINLVSNADPLNLQKTLVTKLMYAGEIEEKELKKVAAVEIINELLPYQYEDIVLTKKDIEIACEGISEETIRNAIESMRIAGVLGSCKFEGGGNAHRYYKPSMEPSRRPYNDD